MPTLLDVIKLNNSDAAVGLIDEASKALPQVRLGQARTIKGLNYKTLVRTGVPSVGFRLANQGTAVAQSVFEQRLVECFLMNPQFEVDQAVADVYEDGWQAYLALEAGGIMEGAMQSLGRAFFYGTKATFGLANSFPGLLQAYDNTNMLVEATGVADANNSSVWAVRWGVQHVQWVLGQGGSASMSDVTKERVVDASSNPYTAYRQELYLRPGLQVGSTFSVARIRNLNVAANTTLTDDMLASLLAKFPTGVRPDAFYMARRSLFQLQASRTATNATGAPAPIPTEAFGVPIEVTDSISIVETQNLEA